ncbi:MAG TPA: hypothetical protein VMF88_15220 [Bacteroidota bacterium]|nr:hypothetical protein [Bacteroidota bacterium]
MNEKSQIVRLVNALACGILLLSSISAAQTDSLGVREGVRRMADAIVRDLHGEGPAAWLRYFSHSENFFMASDGQLSFANTGWKLRNAHWSSLHHSH